MKCFIAPYLDSKESRRLIKLNDMINKELFYDKSTELKNNYDLLNDLVFNFSSRHDLRSNSMQSNKSDCKSGLVTCSVLC